MGSFFLLCDIYFDPLLRAEQSDISLTGRDEGITLVQLLLSSYFIHISHDTLLIIIEMYFYCNYFQMPCNLLT